MSIQKLAAAAWVTKTLGPALFPQRAQETWDESPWALPHSGCGLQGAQLDPRPVPTARCLAAVPAEALASHQPSLFHSARGKRLPRSS